MGEIINFPGRYNESRDTTPADDESNIIEHPNRAAMLAQELKDQLVVASDEHHKAMREILTPESDNAARAINMYFNVIDYLPAIEEMKEAIILVNALAFEQVIADISNSTTKDWEQNPPYWLAMADRVAGLR